MRGQAEAELDKLRHFNDTWFIYEIFFLFSQKYGPLEINRKEPAKTLTCFVSKNLFAENHHKNNFEF